MDINKLLEMARKAAELNQKEAAQKTYVLVLGAYEENIDLLSAGDSGSESIAMVILEAAYYLLASGYEPSLPYTFFYKLYCSGFFHKELYPIMHDNFYLPVVKEHMSLYRRNCEALRKYPYIFKNDFPEPETLETRFFPFRDAYIPYSVSTDTFDAYIDPQETVIDRYYFDGSDRPLLVDGLYSQYQLEYLRDMVRDSRMCGRDNHIYLHYDSFSEFCSYMQILNWSDLLEEEKFIFLFEEEDIKYPIDFAKEYGIDYSEFQPRPFDVSEIKKLILHTQLSSHNGGDYFNEIFHGHPNLIFSTSYMMYTFEYSIADFKKSISTYKSAHKTDFEIAEDLRKTRGFDTHTVLSFLKIKEPTDKDRLVCLLMCKTTAVSHLDVMSRIVPAIYIQPHFSNMICTVYKKIDGTLTCDSAEYDKLLHSPMITGFTYIKTFTPMRRPTTSYAASMKYKVRQYSREMKECGGHSRSVFNNQITGYVQNKTYMYDPEERTYRDGRIVRFEDAKLHPHEVFPALAAFLDIPYTESMTYCSDESGKDPESDEGNARGFDTSAVYRTYDEYANDAERKYLEYLMRDMYQMYRYRPQYIDPDDQVTAGEIEELTEHFECLNSYIEKSYMNVGYEYAMQMKKVFNSCDRNNFEEEKKRALKEMMKAQDFLRKKLVKLLLNKPSFVGRNGQPLKYMKLLEWGSSIID